MSCHLNHTPTGALLSIEQAFIYFFLTLLNQMNKLRYCVLKKLLNVFQTNNLF